MRSSSVRPSAIEDEEEVVKKVEEPKKKNAEREKKSRSQLRKLESEQIKENEKLEENEPDMNQNVDNSNKPPKTYLKRKSKAVKF